MGCGEKRRRKKKNGYALITLARLYRDVNSLFALTTIRHAKKQRRDERNFMMSSFYAAIFIFGSLTHLIVEFNPLA